MSKMMMKNFNLYLFLFSMLVIFACNSNSNKDNKKKTIESNLNSQEDLISKVQDAIDEPHEDIAPIDPAHNNINANQTKTEFSSNLRPNQSILLNQKYTDTIEFLSYDDDGDYFNLLGKKNAEEVGLVYNWDWMNNQQYNFRSGDIIKVQWKMVRIEMAGDEEIVHFSERAIDAERIVSENNSQKSKPKEDNENPDDFVPEGYIITEKNYGDLNKDGQEDCILIVKGTNKNNFVINQFDKKVDRNRRGIIVLFKNQNGYQLATENYECFLSENEDGGVYFPPELWIGEKKGNLVIHYGHGRYGFWKYKFRFQDSNFKLIGYDASSNHGPVINKETSINFLSKKKLIRENTNDDSEGNDEIFEETWKKIEIKELLQLSKIKNFEELNMSKY